jgi:3-dehydroquinate dehydratase / shikimate dehydrogenase
VAPGQVDPWTLADLYRFRATGPGTAVYGVVGNPVMHSRSPLIHNRGYDALGIDAVYVPFLVPDLDDFWPLADALGVKGLSITVPHKETAARTIKEGDDLVAAVGACNTAVRADGGWRGTNTDIAGFMAPLRRAVGEVKGLGATVIGAGGAARSVVHALVTAGARVLVLNRGPDRAARLAREMAVECAGLDSAGCRRAADYADLIVQTTSVGMAAQPGDPAPGLSFTGRELVYELVYAPAETPLLARARAAGCRVIQGKAMLIAQAMEQFRLFTGREYPRDLAASVESSLD